MSESKILGRILHRLNAYLATHWQRPSCLGAPKAPPREYRPRPFEPSVPYERAWTGFYLWEQIKRQRTDARG